MLARTAIRRGITLLELLIVLAIVFVALFIALPTLQPTEEEQQITRAKDHLQYLHSREQLYYSQHGEYAPFSVLAKEASGGTPFDKRFESDNPQVDGISFTGPRVKAKIFDIIAKLPNGTQYRIDQTGVIKSMEGLP
jgi:type II secretory pathway pseudopilin PulG